MHASAHIKARQMRAARALLDWSQDDFAAASGLSIATIRKLELGFVSPRGKASRNTSCNETSDLKGFKMKRIMNFLWIHDPIQPKRQLHPWLLNNLTAAVLHNSDLQIHFWLGGKALCQNKPASTRDSFHLHDLNEIPAYVENSYIFGPWKKGKEPTSIWARVDLARLLVLGHMLQNNPTSINAYADLDVMITPSFVRRLYANTKTQGLTVAGFSREQNTMPLIENCVLSFSPAALPLLAELTLMTEAHLSHRSPAGEDTGWQPLCKFITSTARQHNLRVHDFCIEPIRLKEPKNQAVLDWKEAYSKILALC